MVTKPLDPRAVRVARRCLIDEQDRDELAANCAAALAGAAADSVVIGITAARLHDLWLPKSQIEPIHIATAAPGIASRQMTRGRRPQFRAHRRQLAESDICLVRGVAATSIARTWVDLAGELAVPELVAAGDSALRSGCRVEEMATVIDNSRHLRGVRRARVALPLLDARSRSRPESHLRVASLSARLPHFEVNEPVFRDEGGWLAEPDLSLAEAKIALEYQGVDHAKPDRMRKDITRFTDLRRERWLCMSYGPAEVFGRPWQVAPELEREIAARAPHLLARISHR